MNKYQNTSILTQNGKMKKTSKKNGIRLFNFGIPAYKTQSGKVTCPFAKDCVKFCYAQKGAYSWGNVKPAFEKRYNLTKENDFGAIMTRAIKSVKATHIRIHDSGDFYSPAYLQKWVNVAKINSEVTFYFYTKSVKMILDIELPQNMKSIFSYGSKQDDLINDDQHRHAKIFKNHAELIAAGYIDCSDDDYQAINTNKVGLIIH
jgi:hypothetical protein